MKTAAMIAIVVLASSGGDLLITSGMKQVGEISTLMPRALLSIARKGLTNRNFLLGVLMMTISFFAFLAVLSWADLSFVIPATSVGYVVSTVGAKFVLRERIDRLRWIGTILVCLGVALLSLP
jgi:drug/metabolite transporter (DMT)-like permease